MTADELASCLRLTERRFGLRFEDRPAAIAEITARRAAFHKEPITSYLTRLEAGDRAELRALAAELTVGETYFFRHVEQFRAFAEIALPERIAARGSIRILSAGCSSGEEAYTLAMLARQHVLDPSMVTIRALDVNPNALGRAAQGRYSRWALRATPPELEQRWFVTEGRDVVLSPALRSSVTFEERNLVDDGEVWAPDSWDVVFCRNVLMYFTDDKAQLVIGRITRALAPGGYLFLGHAETLRGRSDDFGLCHTHGTFYYQRLPGTARAASWSAPPPPPVSVAWYEDIQAATERVHAIVDGAVAAIPPTVARSTADLHEIRALYAQERFAEALARIAALPAELGHSRAAVLLRTLVLTHAGRLGDAEAACGELVATDPANADGHYLLALCRDGAGDPHGAAGHARRAVELDPTFAMARVQLGLLARRAGDREAAARELAGAIEVLDREDPERLALFGGGFSRQALVALCRAELAGRTP